MGNTMANTDRKDEAAANDARPKRTISGPGAADFIAAPGGVDTPESDPAKGTRGASVEPSLLDERRLTPDLDEPRDTTERQRLTGDTSGKRPDKSSER